MKLKMMMKGNYLKTSKMRILRLKKKKKRVKAKFHQSLGHPRAEKRKKRRRSPCINVQYALRI
jgi:hypothetical protein